MDVEAWLSQYDVVAADDLRSPAARQLIRFAERYGEGTATYIEARRAEEFELVILEMRTGRPQAAVHDLKVRERVAVRFGADEAMPFVYVLRADFPDTPHQNLTAEGAPRSICIDNRSWAEARLTWTPAELIKRMLTWFQRAVQGQLHDARQPLDPNMFTTGVSFIISREYLRGEQTADLVAVPSEGLEVLEVLPVGQAQAEDKLGQGGVPLSIAGYSVAPENMNRLDFAPDNLSSLAKMLSERGIDLLGDLRERFLNYIGEERPPLWLINARLVVIIEMPIIAPDGGQHGTDTRAFLLHNTLGEVAVALGIAHRQERRDEGSAVGYLRAMPAGEQDDDVLRGMLALAAEVHVAFDRELATKLTGRDEPDERRAVIVGAGAAGSHVATCLAREGRFRWTVIDDDRLLPHNIARHIGFRVNVPDHKADILAGAIAGLLQDRDASAGPIRANVMADGDAREPIEQALGDADLVIDATASVLAERYLSDHDCTARRASVFFNPAGTAAVLLAEPANRSVTLRDLEAQYLGHVVREETLADHLLTPEREFAYTGACRALTNLIPESRAMTLSGLLSQGLGRVVDSDEGALCVWSLAEDGAVALHAFDAAAVTRFEVGEWVVTIDDALVERLAQMRTAALPNETGGVLTGVVDIPHHSIHIVDASAAPPDSAESSNGFTRGRQGVAELLESAEIRSQGQLRYVGEWHSHPPRSSAAPSAVDLVQIDWLAALFDMDTLPALMLIAADDGFNVIFAQNAAAATQEAEHQEISAGAGR